MCVIDQNHGPGLVVLDSNRLESSSGQVQALKDASRALSCNIDPNSEIEIPGLSEEMGPACAALEEKCPGIFMDDDSSFNNDFEE